MDDRECGKEDVIESAVASVNLLVSRFIIPSPINRAHACSAGSRSSHETAPAGFSINKSGTIVQLISLSPSLLPQDLLSSPVIRLSLHNPRLDRLGTGEVKQLGNMNEDTVDG